jgi:hypothetical protein
MTPKEKAKELVEKFELIFISSNADAWTIPGKKCALIAVDEIIAVIDVFELSNHGKVGNNYGQYFWLQVKEEIQKL